MSGMIHWLPIEPLEQRYTAQWAKWFPRQFAEMGLDWRAYFGKPVGPIKSGEFLDVYGTHIYKGSQLVSLIEAIRDGKVKDGDVIFFGDLWYPGLESLAYIRQGAGIDFRIVGILHAGTYDPHDFLTQKGMRSWGQPLEQSWLSFVDAVFLGTDFHRSLILQGHPTVDASKLRVTGLPFYPVECCSSLAVSWDKRPYQVVFPHRLAPEKSPEKFDALLKSSGLQGCRTMDFVAGRPKFMFYDLLRHSQVAISYAQQETFGIAMLEACANGCLPLVPDRLSYSEMYPPEFKYSKEEEPYLAERVRSMLGNWTTSVAEVAWETACRYRGSIQRMIQEIDTL